MNILRRDASLDTIRQRDEEAAYLRMRALFSVDAEPSTFANRLELPEVFTHEALKDVRSIEVVTLDDGRKGLEGDR